MVIWVIGLSGSGKTFFSERLFKNLKKKNKKIKWIDGDKFRKQFSKDLGYSLSDRKKNSARIQKQCKIYEKKGYLVICSILSIFKEHQKKNRKLFNDYIQIYIYVETKVLKKRNNKKIYSRKKNIAGVDIKFPKPFKPDFIFKNNYKKNFLKNCQKIIKKVNEKL